MKKLCVTVLIGALVTGWAAVGVAAESGWFETIDAVERDIEAAERQRRQVRRRADALDEVLESEVASPETARRAAGDLRRDVSRRVAVWDGARRRADRMAWIEGGGESRAVQRSLKRAGAPVDDEWRRQVELLAELDDGVEYSLALVGRRARLEVQYAHDSAEVEKAEEERREVVEDREDEDVDQEIEETARELQETLDLLNPLTSREGFYRRKGALIPPVGGEPDYEFGPRQRSESYTTVRHTGLTWKIPVGTEVEAVGAGTVAEVGRMPGFGKLVIIDHGDDHHSVYAHLDEHRVEQGDEVEERDVIGLSGESGSPEGPRLYFELRRQGQPVDPEEWFVSE